MDILHYTKIQLIEYRRELENTRDIFRLLVLIEELDYLKWRLEALTKEA